MAQQLADRVKETTTTTGTGAITLAGAMTGFRAFSSICSVGDTCYYALQSVDGSGNPTGSWEVGLGTYSATSTLTRTTVLASSNAGAAVNLPAGTTQVWMDVPASLFPGGAMQKALGYIQVQENQANGTNGGTSAAAGTQTRVLNTVVSNTITGASLASNQITLPAGTYQIAASAPADGVSTHQASLFNATGSATLLTGTSEFSNIGSVQSRSFISGTFTLASSAALQVNHYTNVSVATTGLGKAASSGLGEVYTQVMITKVA